MNIQQINLDNSYDLLINRRVDIEITNLHSDWISSEALWKVALILLYRSQTTGNGVDPNTLAEFIVRLKKHEIESGGPYSDDETKHDLITNIFIHQLLMAYGVILPNLEKYITKHIAGSPKALDDSVSQRWFFTWANSINLSNSKTPIVIEKNTDHFPELQNNLKSQSEHMLNKIAEYDTSGEIRNFSSIFLQSLKKKHSINDTDVTSLDNANLYAWLAYIIYDDVVDEKKNIDLLPLANISQRKAFTQYMNFCAHNNLPNKLVVTAFNEVDQAMSEEINTNSALWSKVEQMKFPVIDDEFISSKSIGHLLGPMLIIRVLGYDEKHIMELELALKKYLVAKQICDDLRDFEDDLAQGIITYPISIAAQQILPSFKPDSEATLLSKIKDYHWQTGLERTAKFALDNINSTMKIAKKYCHQNSQLETAVFERIRISLESTLKHHAEKKQFLDTYRTLT